MNSFNSLAMSPFARMLLLNLLVFIFGILQPICPARAQSDADPKVAVNSANLRDSLQAAEKLIVEGKTEEAFAIYNQVLTNADLLSQVNLGKFYYNLGVNAARANRTGLAIAYMHNTLSENAFDSDARHNYNLLRKTVAEKPGFTETYIEWNWLRPILGYTATGIFLLGAGLFLLVILLNILFLRNSTIHWVALVLLLPTLGIGLYGKYLQGEGLAVVITSQPVLRSGPSDSFPEIISLQEGSEVNVVESREQWLKIRMRLVSNPEEPLVGWINERDLLQIHQ